MKLIALLSAFLLPFAASAALPKAEDLVTHAKIENVESLKSEKGKVIPGKYIITVDKKFLSDDGAMWVDIHGTTVRYTFQRYLLTTSKGFVGVFQGKPTNQFLLQIDPNNPPFTTRNLFGADVLLLTLNYDPIAP